MTIRRNPPVLFGSLLMLLATACAETTGPLNGRITVRNSMSDTLSLSVWDLEGSNTIDPPNVVPRRASLGSNVLAPGQSREIRVGDIPGYQRRSGLRVFTWRVQGDVVQFGPTFTWTNEQMQQSGFMLDLAIAVPFE
jgi:hypothetical protein